MLFPVLQESPLISREYDVPEQLVESGQYSMVAYAAWEAVARQATAARALKRDPCILKKIDFRVLFKKVLGVTCDSDKTGVLSDCVLSLLDIRSPFIAFRVSL